LLGGVAVGLSAWQPAAPAVSVAPSAQARDPAPARRAVPALSAQAAAPTRLGVAAQVQQMNAQLQDPYKKWLEEDVVYIIQPEEKAAFEKLQTNPEREMFIEQFWLRRDPTPGTVENEFKEEHYRRIAYANGHFIESVPGWKTNRGMYYIRFGPPDEIEDHMSAQPRFQTWRYRDIPGRGPVMIVFTDVNGTGDYVLPKHTVPGEDRVFFYFYKESQ
jgi:GWxTD domain-containing protein